MEQPATNRNESLRMGMLQVRRLAYAFAEQSRDLWTLRQQCSALEKERNALEAGQEQRHDLLELGEQSLQRLRRETETRMRTIVLTTGNEERLSDLQKHLARLDLPVHELTCLHERISEEFRLLFPTRPHSLTTDRQAAVDGSTDFLNEYRLRGESPHSHIPFTDKENTHGTVRR
ncbi:MAG TPA: hypothetical protein PK395_07150 [bacterium]|nr:hypothetical protein [bacterium]HQP96898.1 hypothetical protein [bacterium]